ncbi:hypothetical protein GCM10009830_41160 [Glycomyces endophyticus]|uniref:Uncharacterized protein n=1 Tax=Glycomyces endophyticus TaxID=480996 RepID=A0ABN2HKJ2_9ACTN
MAALGRGEDRGVEGEEVAQGARVVGGAGLAGELADADRGLVEEPLHDPVHGAGDLGALVVGEVAAAGDPGQLGVDDVGGGRPEGGDGGGDGVGAEALVVGLDLLGEEALDLGEGVGGGARGVGPLDLGDVDDGDAREQGDLLGDVLGEGQVAHHERAVAAGEVGGAQHRLGRGGGADEEVDARGEGGEVVVVGGAGVPHRGEALGLGAVAVRDGQGRDAGAREGRGGERAHGAGAHDGGAGLGEPVLEAVPGEGALGEVEGGGDDGGRGGVDVGLGVDPLPDAQGLLEQLVEVAADLVGLARGVVGVAQLPEDLRLAGDHRVEAGGDAEGVGDGVGAVAHVPAGREVEVGLDLGEAPDAVELVDDGGEPAVEAARDGVDLDPVAGGEDDGLADLAAAQERAREVGGGLGADREPFQGLDRRAAVRDADNQEVHFTVPVSC